MMQQALIISQQLFIDGAFTFLQFCWSKRFIHFAMKKKYFSGKKIFHGKGALSNLVTHDATSTDNKSTAVHRWSIYFPAILLVKKVH